MKKILLLLSVLLVLLLAVGASADTFTFDITDANTNTLTPPFGTVLVTLTDSTHATVVFTSANSYVIGNGQAFDINVNSTGFTATQPASQTGFSFDSNPTQNPVDGLGHYNVVLNDGDGFSNGGYTTAEIDLLNNSGSWGSASAVLIGNDNVPQYLAAIHFASTTNLANTFKAAGPGEGVPNAPEPATMLLFGSGLIGLAGYGRKKFFKK